ncbi:MAG: TspO/MBR family protein, partial [Pseudomonadota bacterium]
WLFAPAWTLLFFMVAWSGYTFYMAAEPGERLVPLLAYGAHLVFNFAWSAFFFGAKRMDIALVDALLMLTAIAINIALFWPISQTAALLLVPYFFWTCFAAILNRAMLQHNPQYRRF